MTGTEGLMLRGGGRPPAARPGPGTAARRDSGRRPGHEAVAGPAAAEAPARRLRAAILGWQRSFPGLPYRLPRRDRLQGVRCVGQGAGARVSGVLAPLLRHDVSTGAGATVIELRGGGLAGPARGAADRAGRAVLEWEPGNPDSACWNPLARPTPAAAERLEQALRRLGGHAAPGQAAAPRGPDPLLRHAVAAVASSGRVPDLLALQRFLEASPSRQAELAMGDAAAARYFRDVCRRWSADRREGRLGAFLGPLAVLLGQPLLRRALCPGDGAPVIDLPACLREGRVLLATLPPGGPSGVGEALGGLLLAAFQAAAYGRGPGAPFHALYVDDPERLSGGRLDGFVRAAGSVGIGAVCGAEGLDRHGGAGDVLGAWGTAVVVRCGPADARALAPALPARGRRTWVPADLSGLPYGCGLAYRSGRRPWIRVLRLPAAG